MDSTQLDIEPEFERYFAKARTEFPSMFVSRETESEFRAATEQMMSTMRSFGRQLIVAELFNSVRNFMLHDLDAMEAALSAPDVAAEVSARVMTNTVGILRSIQAGGYSEVLRVIEEYLIGRLYPPPEKAPDCHLYDSPGLQPLRMNLEKD